MRRRTIRELSALADGTLPADRREVVARRVSKSPRRARALESHLIAIEAIRRAETPAPAELHERIKALLECDVWLAHRAGDETRGGPWR